MSDDDREVVLGHHDERGTTRPRRGAVLYDALVVSWVMGGIGAALARVVPTVGEVPLLLLWVLLVAVEWAACGSPGKLVTGSRVEMLDGSRPGLLAVVLRRPWGWLLPLGLVSPVLRAGTQVVAIVIALGMLVTIERSDDRRGFHDRLAGTRVVDGPVDRRARIAVVVATAVLVLVALLLGAQTTPVDLA